MDKKPERKEYEKISHTQIKNINFFLIDLTYRAPHTHHDFEILQVIEGELHIKPSPKILSSAPARSLSLIRIHFIRYTVFRVIVSC